MATYHEFVIKGNRKLLHGFLRGFQAAKNIKRGLICCGDYPINTHHIKNLLTLHGDRTHVICDSRLRSSLIAAVEKAVDLEFEILSDGEIFATSFEFRFETFNKKVASDLKRIFRRPPAGLTVEDYEPEEIVDPDAKGVEVYTPVHDYIFKGEGVVKGDIEKLCRFHAKLSANEFIEVEDIEIHS
ncbi:MAG: hypothetical protein P8181_12435 [bacterium]